MPNVTPDRLTEIARSLLIASRHDISWNTELASKIIS